MTLIRSLAALFAASSAALAASSIEIHGSQFVNSKSNERLQLLGVDYQPGGSAGYTSKKDPLSNADSCLRDAALMQKLGVNTVRIYNIEPSLNHDECMSIFNEAGIYLILDVNSPLVNGALNAAEPWTTYNKYYLKRIFSMVEAFKNYPNVIGFFGGNEVISQNSVKQTPSYVRAVQRDLKNYMKKHANRVIPVGYSAADVRETVPDQFNYLTCDDGNDSAADFFGMNVYSWCGDSTYKESGYSDLTDIFKGTSVPVFFSEYGCNEVTPRQFQEVGTLYGETMSEVWSGGLVYEWTQEANNYGLVKVNSDGSAKLLNDFATLQSQFSKLDMNKLQSVNSTDSKATAPKCSKNLIKESSFPNDFTLPDLPPGGQDLIDNGVTDITAGKIVDIKNKKVKAKVTDENGKEISNLELKTVDDSTSNTPSSSKSSSSSSSSATSASSIKPTSGSSTSTSTSTSTSSSSATSSATSSSGSETQKEAAVSASGSALPTSNGVNGPVTFSAIAGAAAFFALFM
ncbi:hypothetical protein KEM55_003520 [Ascosphaera atra]|nr:hypothetical protein KEM55_003520 [Ascosphaera atra]